MERAAAVTSQWNFDAVKEPRGFIKLIEFIIAIFAFATTCSVSSSSSFDITCGSKNQTVEFEFGYPFKLHDAQKTLPLCPGGNSTGVSGPYGDFAAASQFYVFVGVMAFLYCIAAVILYVCFDEKYRQHDQIPVADFVTSCVLAVLWLIASAAWSTGVTNVKYYMDPSEMIRVHFPEDCLLDGKPICYPNSYGNFASLNVSLIFGFLNMCVWGGNLWFLFKETKWFKVTNEHPEVTPTDTPQTV